MKPLAIFFLFIPLIFLSGCFEIIEEVNVNPNGSGTLTLTINANQSKDQLDKVLSKDSIYNLKVPQRKDIDAAINDVSYKLKSVKGISNVEITRDFQSYILIIKCSFASTNALNTAINNIWLLYDKKAPTNKAYFSYGSTIFTRTLDYKLIENVKDKLGVQEKDILSKATYTMIYRFPTEISSYTNTNAALSKSKKAIILKNNLLDIVSGKKNIRNEITLNQ